MAAEAEPPAPAPPPPAPTTSQPPPPRQLLESQLQVEYKVERSYQATFTRRPLEMVVNMSTVGKRGLCVVESTSTGAAGMPGQAAELGIRKGDVLIALYGASLVGWTWAEFLEKIQAAALPFTVTLVRPRPETPPPAAAPVPAPAKRATTASTAPAPASAAAPPAAPPAATRPPPTATAAAPAPSAQASAPAASAPVPAPAPAPEQQPRPPPPSPSTAAPSAPPLRPLQPPQPPRPQPTAQAPASASDGNGASAAPTRPPPAPQQQQQQQEPRPPSPESQRLLQELRQRQRERQQELQSRQQEPLHPNETAEAMLERLGREEFLAFALGEDEDEEADGGGAGGSRRRKRPCPSPLLEAPPLADLELDPWTAQMVAEIKARYAQLRALRVEERATSLHTEEYSRHLLAQAREAQLFIVEAGKLLDQRMLEFRDRVMSGRRDNAAVDLAAAQQRWDGFNEQRRRFQDLSAAVTMAVRQLDALVRIHAPQFASRMDQELNGLLQSLDGAMLHIAQWEAIVADLSSTRPPALASASALAAAAASAAAAAAAAGGGAGAAAAASRVVQNGGVQHEQGFASISRPTLTRPASQSQQSSSQSQQLESYAYGMPYVFGGKEWVNFDKTPPAEGPAHQIPEHALPSPYNNDFTPLVVPPPPGPTADFRQHTPPGERLCRWKPLPSEPPAGTGDPLQAAAAAAIAAENERKLAEHVAKFPGPGCGEEAALWVLYRSGWSFAVADFRLRNHLRQHNNRPPPEQDEKGAPVPPLERFTPSDEAVFLQAMQERPKEFYHAARKTGKSTKACVCYYYDKFKRRRDVYPAIKVASAAKVAERHAERDRLAAQEQEEDEEYDGED